MSFRASSGACRNDEESPRRRAKCYPFEPPPDFLATARRLRAMTRRPRSRALPKTERGEKDLNGARHKAP